MSYFILISIAILISLGYLFTKRGNKTKLSISIFLNVTLIYIISGFYKITLIKGETQIGEVPTWIAYLDPSKTYIVIFTHAAFSLITGVLLGYTFTKNKRYLKVTALLTVSIFTFYIFRYEIEDGLECLAYYKQCTAKRIEMTHEECKQRKDAVAYLINDKICLVQKD